MTVNMSILCLSVSQIIILRNNLKRLLHSYITSAKKNPNNIVLRGDELKKHYIQIFEYCLFDMNNVFYQQIKSLLNIRVSTDSLSLEYNMSISIFEIDVTKCQFKHNL